MSEQARTQTAVDEQLPKVHFYLPGMTTLSGEPGPIGRFIAELSRDRSLPKRLSVLIEDRN